MFILQDLTVLAHSYHIYLYSCHSFFSFKLSLHESHQPLSKQQHQ